MLKALNINERTSTSMSTRGTDNAPPRSTKCLCFLRKTLHLTQLCIWTPSTALGPFDDNDYPLNIFTTSWQTSTWAELEREMQYTKVAPQHLCGTSEFCVEIISLFSCHLGSGCWCLAWARCFMGNTTESHLQQMLIGRASHLGRSLEYRQDCTLSMHDENGFKQFQKEWIDQETFWVKKKKKSLTVTI